MPKKQNKGLAQARAVRATNMVRGKKKSKATHTMPDGTKMKGKTHPKKKKKY